ncbi:hypothetical protein Q9299_20885 [Gemmobacter fulvus]|uniref:hypothetical protein n=1 Tax=Gemmobacter fulvus TaxID=2840474 RepID=UPI002796AC9E|nr:hypothetical protein [Gemmobacter fulvus]MDQ1850764.1 hypothetical protein [Gemmobacter fulvus]
MILKPYAFTSPLARYGYDLDAFPFDDAYLDRLLRLMGRDRTGIDLHDFTQDHFNLLYGFVQGEAREAAFPSVEEETKTLTRAQDAAWKLLEALNTVRLTGAAGQRLKAEAEALPDRRFERNGVTVADLFAGPDFDPQSPLRALLFDLRVALQRAKIEKPRDLPAPFDGTDTSAKEQADRWIRLVARDDDPEQRYRDRHAEHGHSANFGLTVFAWRLWDMWQKYSDLPFTEGRYESAQVNYNSPTVDFAETCLKAFGAKYPRSLIAKRLRQVRELAAAEEAQ